MENIICGGGGTGGRNPRDGNIEGHQRSAWRHEGGRHYLDEVDRAQRQQEERLMGEHEEDEDDDDDDSDNDQELTLEDLSSPAAAFTRDMHSSAELSMAETAAAIGDIATNDNGATNADFFQVVPHPFLSNGAVPVPQQLAAAAAPASPAFSGMPNEGTSSDPSSSRLRLNLPSRQHNNNEVDMDFDRFEDDDEDDDDEDDDEDEEEEEEDDDDDDDIDQHYGTLAGARSHVMKRGGTRFRKTGSPGSGKKKAPRRHRRRRSSHSSAVSQEDEDHEEDHFQNESDDDQDDNDENASDGDSNQDQDTNDEEDEEDSIVFDGSMAGMEDEMCWQYTKYLENNMSAAEHDTSRRFMQFMDETQGPNSFLANASVRAVPQSVRNASSNFFSSVRGDVLEFLGDGGGGNVRSSKKVGEHGDNRGGDAHDGFALDDIISEADYYDDDYDPERKWRKRRGFCYLAFFFSVTMLTLAWFVTMAIQHATDLKNEARARKETKKKKNPTFWSDLVGAKERTGGGGDGVAGNDGIPTDQQGEGLGRPAFVTQSPYRSSTYYTSTKSMATLEKLEQRMEEMKARKKDRRDIKTRLAVVRPFCAFDAEPLPTTFACWNALAPCKAAASDLGVFYDEDDEIFGQAADHNQGGDMVNVTSDGVHLGGDKPFFDAVGSDILKHAKADLFLFYSQTFSENDVAISAVDAILDKFLEVGGWSQCFENVYAIEANIPSELDLYIPSAQEELYNWVNGPNRQFEAAFRIIQSGEWGHYDSFYLMEGDSIPIKSHWLDVILSEVEAHRPFATLGAKYNGDKWDNFYEQIPLALIRHTNGNAIYNTSHPLLDRLVGQLEVEAPSPWNSIPYDYRMSQMWVEGTLGVVPTLAEKIMLNEEGKNITLANNTAMFRRWAEEWGGEGEEDNPFPETAAIHNYAATNLIPRHLGPEYIIHGAKLYAPWDPTRTQITLVVSEWFMDRSHNLIRDLDSKDHPFSEIIVMLPEAVQAREDYWNLTVIPTRVQRRTRNDYMDICEAEVTTEWFMMTNAYHQVARHVDLMFTPGDYKPVIPFTPATYPFCFKFPYCRETVNLAHRFNPGHDKVVQDFDMLYHTETRNKFCVEWRTKYGANGEGLYKNHKNRVLRRNKVVGPAGPTGTWYTAFLMREGLADAHYKLVDRSLYGARDYFTKVFRREEKLDGMTTEEKALWEAMTFSANFTVLSNFTRPGATPPSFDLSDDCNCRKYETRELCEDSGFGCEWRELFDSCHPPELLDDGAPVCPTTVSPTLAPTVYVDMDYVADTEAPTTAPVPTTAPTYDTYDGGNHWYAGLFRTHQHEIHRGGGGGEATSDQGSDAHEEM